MNNYLRASALLASAALAACGGNVVDGSSDFAPAGDDEPSRSGSTPDIDGTPVLDADQTLPASPQGAPALRCGSTDGDEGTAANPVVLHFDDIWEGGRWLGSVGTGASCYKVKGVTGGNQFFLVSADQEAINRELGLSLGIYEYSGEGFDSVPVCVHEALANTAIQCPTGGTGGVVDVEGHVRYVVIDGSQTQAGGEYSFEAWP